MYMATPKTVVATLTILFKSIMIFITLLWIYIGTWRIFLHCLHSKCRL